MVKKELDAFPRCCLLVIPTERNIENVVYGMIGAAETVCVTEDSISMISESVQAGKRVIVLKMAKRRLPAKHRNFQQSLSREDLVRVASHEDLSEVYFSPYTPQTGAIEEERRLLLQRLKETL